jgi:hypothetical protein
MELIPIPGAEVYYDEHFLQPEEALLFNTLLSKCAWERRKASFGYAVPRDEAYYGDPRNALHIFAARVQAAALDTGIAFAKSPSRGGHTHSGLYQLGFAKVGLQRRALQSVSGWK